MLKNNWLFFLIGVLLVVGTGVVVLSRFMVGKTGQTEVSEAKNTGEIISGSFDPARFKTDEEWQKLLTPSQFLILRRAGTEQAFSNKLNEEYRPGTFYSAGCNQPVFRSEQKYDSGTGWPSFWAPIEPDAVVLRLDKSLFGERRIEVLDKCGGHLGHVFDDGPEPTGQRYCINGLALIFVADPEPDPELTNSEEGQSAN